MSTAPAPVHFSVAGPDCPPALRRATAHLADVQTIAVLGNPAILTHRTLALLCSVRCPGDIILRTYDLAVALRAAGVPVAGGFHSPMERECLRLLLRGTQPVIVCPARGIERLRVPPAWREPLQQGRLLLLSPFAVTQRRTTRELAQRRNRFVAALAAAVFVAHATPAGHTEALCREIRTEGTPLHTFDTPDNANLLTLGARPASTDDMRAWFGA